MDDAAPGSWRRHPAGLQSAAPLSTSTHDEQPANSTAPELHGELMALLLGGARPLPPAASPAAVPAAPLVAAPAGVVPDPTVEELLSLLVATDDARPAPPNPPARWVAPVASGPASAAPPAAYAGQSAARSPAGSIAGAGQTDRAWQAASASAGSGPSRPAPRPLVIAPLPVPPAPAPPPLPSDAPTIDDDDDLWRVPELGGSSSPPSTSGAAGGGGGPASPLPELFVPRLGPPGVLRPRRQHGTVGREIQLRANHFRLLWGAEAARVRGGRVDAGPTIKVYTVTVEARRGAQRVPCSAPRVAILPPFAW